MSALAWIGTVDIAGYTLVVLGRDEIEVENALLAEWHRFAAKNKPHPECPSKNCDWNQFSDYFGAYIRRLHFGQVEFRRLRFGQVEWS